MSSVDGKAMPPARLRRALANEEVRRMVEVTPEDNVLVILSLRVIPGRESTGEGGCCIRGDDWSDETRE